MANKPNKIKVVLSGSFNRHLDAIKTSVEVFRSLGVEILSPEDPAVVDVIGEFVVLASDKRLSVRGIENRHLEAIRQASFLYIECPDGYIGVSTALELGYAVAHQIPVITSAQLSDQTLLQYVDAVAPTPTKALVCLNAWRRQSPKKEHSLLLNPAETLDLVWSKLSLIRSELLFKRQPSDNDPIDAYVAQIKQLLILPARIRVKE